jgi:hypothetical protein
MVLSTNNICSSRSRGATIVDAKELEQRIRGCTTSQQIADLQAQRSGYVQQLEGTALVGARPEPGCVWVHSDRDGDVSIPAEQLPAALKIDPKLTVIGLGTNAERRSELTTAENLAMWDQKILETENFLKHNPDPRLFQAQDLLTFSKSVDSAPLNPAFSCQRAGKLDSPGLSVRLESSNQTAVTVNMLSPIRTQSR